MMKTLLYTAAAVLAAMTLAACEHKELCYGHSGSVSVDVLFDWGNAPGAAPAGMSVYLYPKDGGSPERYELAGHEGGTISVPAGSYTAICQNNDLEAVLLRGTSACNTFEDYTRYTSLLEVMALTTAGEPPQASGAEEEEIVLEPDMLYTGSLDDVEIVYDDEGQTIVFSPVQSVVNFTFTITNAENLNHALSLTGTLSGQSRGIFPAGLTLDEERVTVPFDAQDDGVSTVSGSFRSFGHYDDATQHFFVVYAIMDDGSSWYYTFDVTDQVHDPAQDPYNIHIEIDGLPLPEAIANGGGMQPEVDDWHTETVVLPM